MFLLVAALLFCSCGANPTVPSTPTLRVTSILPAIGSTTGGTSVIIGGTDFAADATVSVGGVTATNVVLQSSTTLQATIAPRSTAGPADIVVTSGGRSATLASGFTFVAPSGANQPPVVASIRSIGSRSGQPQGFADLDETVTLVPTVIDLETSTSDLTYEWTGPGVFAGSGANVGWRLPASAPSTPTPLTATLTVTETFVEGSVTHKNTAVGTFVMQVHESQKEILDIGEDFLTLFSRSEVSTNDVLHNFSTTCDRGDGRADEKSDVDWNREYVIQDFSKFTIARLPPVNINFGSRCSFRLRAADACSSFRVHWEVTYKKGDAFHRVGDRETTDGIDYVTAVLESNRWRLCHSDFDGVSRNLTTGLTRFVQW